MKNVICFLLVLLFVISSVAFAEEFAIHNGVTFGMSKDEVKKTEGDKGFEVDSGFIGEFVLGEKKGDAIVDRIVEVTVGDPNQVYTFGSVAGYDDSYIYFDFSKEGLCSAIYHLGEKGDKSRYSNVLKALEEKYGEPLVNGIDYIPFPVNGKTVLNLYSLFRFNNMINCPVDGMNQWLIKTDGGYVDIILISFAWGSTSDEVLISYSFLSNDNYNSFLEQMEADEQQKLEDNKRKQTELNNDL